MKSKYYVFSLVCLFLLLSCKNENQVVNNESAPTASTLTTLIKYKVLIQDTSSAIFIKKDSLVSKGADVDKALGENVNYLPYKDFQNYLTNIKKLIDGTDAIVANKDMKLIESQQERKSLYMICDSIIYEENGKTIREFACDSTSRLSYIFGLEFYENWSLDEKTGMINKDILGYSVFTKDDLIGFKPYYYFFKNKESFEKVRSKK